MNRLTARPTIAAVAAAVGLVSAACSGPFEAPSEYTRQRVLCGSEESAARSALVEECRASFARDGSCLGYVGFRGQLQGHEIAVQERVVRVAHAEAVSAVSTPHYAGFTADAKGPYFVFAIEAKQVGGTARVANMTPRTLLLADERRGNTRYEDEYAELALRLTVGGESENFRGHSGELTYVVPEPFVLVGQFHGRFGADGDLEGCFALFGREPALGGEP